MKFTNKHNWPDIFVSVLTTYTEKYSRGDSWRTVTQLINPPRALILRNRHDHEIEEDVSERIYSLDGQIAHGLVEAAATKMTDSGWRSEERIFANLYGKSVSGQFDLFHPDKGVLIDFKNAAIYGLKKEPIKREWEEQTNLLAALLRLNGAIIQKIGVFVKARDYRSYEAKDHKRRNEYYPEPIEYKDYPLWSPERAQSFLEKRARLHLDAETIEDEARLPRCTDEEIWKTESLWFVKKSANRTTSGADCFKAEKEAKQWLSQKGVGYEIFHVPGEAKRCANYCKASPFCNQFQERV